MPSTSLEMHQNRFRPGLRTGPQWRSLQRSLRPLASGEIARRVLPKNPTPPRPFGLRPYKLYCVVHQHPPKINPSYGLADTDRHRHRRTQGYSIYRASIASRAEKSILGHKKPKIKVERSIDVAGEYVEKWQYVWYNRLIFYSHVAKLFDRPSYFDDMLLLE